MQKEDLTQSFEPTAEEILSSIYYIRVNESMNILKNSTNSDSAIINFSSFLDDLNNFISNESNKNLIKYFLSSANQGSTQISFKSIFTSDTSNKLFDILGKIITITMNFNYSDFLNFIFSLMETAETVKILKKHIKTLETIFSNDNFFSYLDENEQIQVFFDKSFVQFVDVDLCFLFRHLICEVSPFSIRPKINLSKIISFLSSTIEPEAQIEYSIVLSKLISVNSENRLFLNNNQNFFLFSNCIQSASSEIVIKCFNELVFTEPTNIELLSNIILFYGKYPQHQKSLFQWIFNEIVDNHNDMLNEINNTVPFYGWVIQTTPVNDITSAISVLLKYDVKFISPFLSPLITLLNKGNSKFDEFKFAIQIIESLILHRQICLNDLANKNFLNTFVIDIDIDILGQLFERIYTFSQLVYDIFTLPKSEALRADVINKLIQMVGKYPNNAQFLSIFIVISNSKKNISDLMNTIIECKNGDLSIALGNSFVKSNSVVNYFINNDGIKWLDDVFNKKLINLKQFIFLINSLTKNFYIEEIDEYIKSLPEDHPVFTICNEDLMTLSYGYEYSHHFYPLKITAFFHLLKCPQTISPYNAYMIGKHAFDNMQNKDKLPIFSDIVNRYITDETYQKMVEMDSSKFDLFCDSNFDHFPLFQVNEFFDKNHFDVKFKAISFWFKFDKTYKYECKIPFFNSEKLQLYMKNSALLANYDGVEYDSPVNPFKWNHITVVVSSQKFSHYIEVYVNLNKAVFTSSYQLSELPHFEFSTYSAYLFIGPSIRIYQNEQVINDIETIFKKGPSYTGKLNETFSITPLRKEYLHVGKNVDAVEYQGFPLHFISKGKRMILFDRLTDPKLKENEFISFIMIYFKVYTILFNSFYDFLPSLLTAYSKTSQFVNSNILYKSFEFHSKYRPKSEIINTVIGHEQFWSMVQNDRIIISLFLTYNNFEFYQEKTQLEIFFLIKSYFIPTKLKVFEYLFQSKNCQSILHKFLIGSHFISSKQDKFIQCNILNADSISESKDDIVIIDQNNISIQCNLHNEMFNESYLPNFDLTCLFQSIQSNSFQKNFANFLNKFILANNNVSCIEIDNIYSLFITSDIELKVILYSILLNYEKKSPNSIQFDSTFCCSILPLFNYKNVWIETLNLLTNETTVITKNSLLPVVFSLLWSYTVSSLHSIASIGKPIENENEISNAITRVINVISNENNIKIIASDKNVLKFIASWFPFLLGIDQSNQEIRSSDERFISQNFKLKGVEFTSPSPFCFLSMLWRNVINEANLPFQTKEEYYTNLQTFILQSNIFKFYFNLIFHLNDSNFVDVLHSFYSIPLISGNSKIAKSFIGYFTHSFLNIIAENSQLVLRINLIFPFIHFISMSDWINEQYLPIIISDIFLISFVINSAEINRFHKFIPQINLLLINLLLSILKICNKNENYITLIDTLYQVLNQQKKLFNLITIESQNTIEFYLQFLNETSHICSKKELSNKVKVEFENLLKMNPNKKIQIIIDENAKKNVNIDLNKWIDYVKANINLNKMYNITFSNIKDYSKAYTVSFTNALEKQHQISEYLHQLFIETDKFIELKKNWSHIFYVDHHK